ncbi:MAG: DNA primase [Lachnospiraceae bacterium]|nr:DNA primase [Lachnospiraceae bacterium]
MAYYKEEIIEEIRQRNDIVDVIGSVVKLKKSGSNYFGLCPFHSEKTGSFSVNREKQIYHCFGCGVGGNVISFVMDYENYSFPEAVKYLADRAGMELPDIKESEEEKREHRFRENVLNCLKSAAIYYHKKLKSPEGRIGMEYFKKRGLTDETIRSFGLGFSGKGYDGAVKYLKSQGFSDKVIEAAGLCNISEKYGMTDRFFNRVMFPIMDINNKVIGFGGRVLGDGTPKYLNSPETVVFDKSRNMYGMNVARRSRKPYRIVCEGYMDVISMHQAGFTEAVASLGTAFTSGHANLLRRYTDDVRLTYDSDSAGQKAAMRAIPICRSAGLKTSIIHLDPYKDPDEFIKDLGNDEFQKRIDESQNSFFFELDYIKKEYNMSDPEGRTSFQSEVAAKLAGIDDELKRDNYISSVAARYSIKEDVLRRAVAISQERVGREGTDGITANLRGRSFKESRNGKDDNKDHNMGIEKAERYLLTWMTDDRRIYEAVIPYLEVEDYTEGTVREFAKELYAGYARGDPAIAEIMTKFTEKDQASVVSEIINTRLEMLESESERSKALTDLVIKIKKAALERKKNADDGADPLKKAMDEKKALAKLKNIRISL